MSACSKCDQWPRPAIDGAHSPTRDNVCCISVAAVTVTSAMLTPTNLTASYLRVSDELNRKLTRFAVFINMLSIILVFTYIVKWFLSYGLFHYYI